MGDMTTGRNIPLWEDSEKKDIYLTYCPGTGKVDEEQKSGKSGIIRDTGRKPAVIVCPGGGYMMTGDREAEPVANKFAEYGYKAFVLRYSTAASKDPRFPAPLVDLAKAILYLREKSGEWNIDVSKIVVCGFSAGGHLAASLGVFWNNRFLTDRLGALGLINGQGLPDSRVLKPAALILGYPVVDYRRILKEWVSVAPDGQIIDLRRICNETVFGNPDPSDEDLAGISPVNFVSSDTPPTFIWHTAEDDIVYVEGSLEYCLELKKHNVPFELHVFEKGPHALSLCDETTVRSPEHLELTCRAWFGLALNWLDSRLNK